jgi:hypothetical protein
MPPIIKVSQYQQGFTFTLFRQASSGRLKRWYYLNRFSLSTTSSPTFVGFFVTGMMGRFG